MIGFPAKQQLRNAMLELQQCGFQALGNHAAQGSGVCAAALSADGSTWVDIKVPQADLGSRLRRLLGTGVLRGALCTAQYTTQFSNGSFLVTTTATSASDLPALPGSRLERLPPATSIALAALRHMQRIEAALLAEHPLKPLIHTCADEVEAARRSRTSGAARPLTVPGLCALGVPAHLAQLIAGDCVEAAETLRLI